MSGSDDLVLAFGSYGLDPAGHTLTRDGTPARSGRVRIAGVAACDG